jgi:hypothetical protein
MYVPCAFSIISVVIGAGSLFVKSFRLVAGHLWLQVQLIQLHVLVAGLRSRSVDQHFALGSLVCTAGLS